MSPYKGFIGFTLGFIWEKTNECPLKINGWKMHFFLGWHIFRDCVSFREGIGDEILLYWILMKPADS